MLGPLTWIEIPENELKEMLRKYREMMEEEKNIELLKTLKIYLENNMNYSVTAEKMYVHINTIRKRIDKVNDLVKIDWEDHVDRLKMEILLQFWDCRSENINFVEKVSHLRYNKIRGNKNGDARLF